MKFDDKYGDVCVGYSKNHEYNEDFEEMGLACPYEHCIETCELKENSPTSCSVFGHSCPGGLGQIISCDSDDCEYAWDNITERGIEE